MSTRLAPASGYEVEDALSSHPAVKEVEAIGVLDEYRGG